MINGKELEQEHFKFLRSILTSGVKCSSEIPARVTMAKMSSIREKCF